MYAKMNVQTDARRKKILLIENDWDVIESVSFNLRMAGYQVLVAANPQQAEKLLKSEIYHVAIIDLRLMNDHQASDESGFRVAEHVPDGVPFIIYTGYDSKEAIRKALGSLEAAAILAKYTPDSATLLVDEINRLFAEQVPYNFNLDISSSPDLAEMAGQIELQDEPAPSSEDLELILRCLFRKANTLRLTWLLPPEVAPTLSQSGALLLSATPRLGHTWAVPRVVKISGRADIAREAENYESFRHYLGFQRRAHLDAQPAYSRSLGGLVYTLLNAGPADEISSLKELYGMEPAEKLAGALDCFFEGTFRTLFAGAQPARLDLAREYVQGLNLTPEKLRAALRQLREQAPDAAEVRFPGLAQALPNPLAWVLVGDGFRSWPVETRRCLVHGDLHSRNMLVDREAHVWLIDFARVETSHVLRDFAELESDLKFNLLVEDDLAALAEFESALLACERLQDPLPERSFNNERLDYAYTILRRLHLTAARLIELSGDASEYWFALLMHTLNILRLRHIAPGKKEHALLSAALLCRQLQAAPTA